MHAALREMLNGKRLLIAVAAPSEAKAVLVGLRSATPAPDDGVWRIVEADENVDLLLTGVGKSLAAGGVARVLDPRRHAAVLSVGVAGTYGKAPLGAVVAADSCVLADEGVQTPDGFTDLASLGFAPCASGMVVPVDTRLLGVLRSVVGIVGPVATVSTCSGTDALAAEIAARTGAVAEAMEGAAVALVALRLGVALGELRVVSNTTGDRARQVWKVKEALSGLSQVIGTLCS